MKKFFFALLFLLTAGGCSKPAWIAKLHMMQAENAYNRGHELRLQKIPYEARLKHYRIACHEFLKAYEKDPKVFTLYRIEMAGDACLRIEDQESVALFREFEAVYIAEHPTETEYGDAGAWMNVE